MIATALLYKETGFNWMPVIPENWETNRAKAIFQERSIKGFPDEPLLAASQKQGVVLKGMLEQRSMEAVQNFESFKLVEKDDFVISLRSFEGGIELAYYRGIISPVYSIFYFRENKHNRDFFKYLFKSRMFIQELNVYKKGIRDGQSISYSEFANIYLPVPPKNEQDEIVQYIKAQEEKINLFIEKKQRFIELLKEQRQSVIENAITYKTGWTQSRIKNVSKMFGRIGFRGYQTSDLVDEGEGAITISPSNMKHHKQMDFSNCSYLSWEKYEESPEIKIFEGDIIMVKTGATYGKVAQVLGLPEKATINPQLMVFKEIILDNDYFFYFLQSGLIKEQMEKNVIGGTIPTISQTKIGSMRLHYPPIEEQKQIVSHIKTETATIDTAIAKAEREIELIREYKEAMIAEAVMGKRK